MEELLQELVEFLKGVGEQVAGSGVLRTLRPAIDWVRSHHSVIRHAVGDRFSAAARRIKEIGHYPVAVWLIGMAASVNVVAIAGFALGRDLSLGEIMWWYYTPLFSFYTWLLATAASRAGKMVWGNIRKP